MIAVPIISPYTSSPYGTGVYKQFLPKIVINENSQNEMDDAAEYAYRHGHGYVPSHLPDELFEEAYLGRT